MIIHRGAIQEILYCPSVRSCLFPDLLLSYLNSSNCRCTQAQNCTELISQQSVLLLLKLMELLLALLELISSSLPCPHRSVPPSPPSH